MPKGDRNGPRGQGPRTGRAAGHCAGFNTPGYANPGPGRGFGRGAGWRCGRPGRGGGRGYGAHAPLIGPVQEPGPQATDEMAYLENTVRSLEAELEEVRARLSRLSE